MLILELILAIFVFLGLSAGVSPRVRRMFSAFFALLMGNVEKNNPEALLELEKEQIRRAEAAFNDGLGDQAAQSEQLMRSIKEDERREKELTASVNVYLRKAEQNPVTATDSKKNAASFALQLQKIQESLTEKHAMLAEQEHQYKLLTRQRDEAIAKAKERIENITRNLRDAKLKEKGAALIEMGNSLVSSIGSSSDTLSRLEETVNARRDKAAGRARVANDAGTDDTAAQEITAEVEDSEAASALESFIKTKGNAALMPPDESSKMPVMQKTQAVEVPRQ